MQIAKIISTLSIALSSFWISGIIFEGIYKSNNETAFAFLVGLIVAIAAYAYIFHSKSHFWVAVDPSWKIYGAFTLIAYILSVPVGLLIGYIYIFIYFGEVKEAKGEISVLLALMATWLPLWWSPALGIICGKFYSIKKASNKRCTRRIVSSAYAISLREVYCNALLTIRR